MELSNIANLTGLLLLTGFFSAFPGLGSGILIFILGSETLWINYFPNMNLSLIICFIGGGVIRFLINKTERCYDSFAVLLALFGLVVVLSSVICINPLDAISNALILLLLLMVAYLFDCNTRHRQRKEWMVCFLLITSMLNCLIILLQTPWKMLLATLLIDGWIPTFNLLSNQDSTVNPISGGFENSILSGLFLVLVIPLWIDLLYQVKKVSNQGLSVWMIYGAILLTVISNFLIFSKILGSMTVVILLAGWVLYFNSGLLQRYQYYIIPSIVGVLGGLLGIAVIYFTYFGMGIGLEDRLEKLLKSIYAFTQNPIFGIGYCQLNQYLAWQEVAFQSSNEHGYSSLFLLLAETGLIGAVLLSVLMVHVFDLFHFNSHNRSQNTDWIMLGVFLVLGASVLFFPVHQYLIFWCIFGLVSGSQKRVHEPTPICQHPKAEYKIEYSHKE